VRANADPEKPRRSSKELNKRGSIVTRCNLDW
jgi:hypothetical protein